MQDLARVGTLYGIRVHGAYDPREGYRFNGNKLLIDPWARDIVGDVQVASVAARATTPTDAEGLKPDFTDSAAAMPRCRVIDGAFDWNGDRQPAVPWRDSLIYELHVKGFTQLHPDVPPEWRGKYLALTVPGRARAPEVARRHRGRAHAGARLHQRGLPARARAH